MKRFIMVLLLGVATSACAQMGNLVSFTVSEADLERLILQQLETESLSVELAGMSAALDVQSLGIRIDPDEDGKVHLNTQSLVTAQAFGRSFPLKADIKVAGVPSYDATEHAIFLRQVQLDDAVIDAVIDAAGMQFNLNNVSTEIYQVLNRWLDENPVYRLDPEDSRYQLLRELGLNIEVQPGQLRLTPAQ
ncbi:DUF1439 domain-containing protein [Aliidiomarina sp. Khilg15.8]